MLGSTHIIVGAAIAQASGNYPLGLSLAFLSHFILDAIPHLDFAVPEKGNPKTYQYILAGLDILAAFGILIYLVLLNPSLNLNLIFFGGLINLSIDLWSHLPLWKSQTQKIWPGFYQFHRNLQNWWPKPNKLIGYGTNLILLAGGLWLLLGQSF